MNEHSEERPIWLVEDSPADVDLVRYAFAEYGVKGEVKVFADGESAIRQIEEIDNKRIDLGCGCEPRLALLDVNLPRRTGLEVLARIRASRTLASIPVIIFTSSASELDRAVSDDLGAQEYVLKGLDLDAFSQIGAVVKRLLHQEPN